MEAPAEWRRQSRLVTALKPSHPVARVVRVIFWEYFVAREDQALVQEIKVIKILLLIRYQKTKFFFKFTEAKPKPSDVAETFF